jgi:hypothetical protein
LPKQPVFETMKSAGVGPICRFVAFGDVNADVRETEKRA